MSKVGKAAELNSELQIATAIIVTDEEADKIKSQEKDKHNKKTIIKWVILSIIFAVILVCIIIGIYYGTKAVGSTTKSATSGIGSIIDTATNVADTGLEVAGAAGGTYLVNYFLGEYIEDAATTLYNIIFGTESVSAALAGASKTTEGIVDTVEAGFEGGVSAGKIGNDVNVASAEDAVEAAALDA